MAYEDTGDEGGRFATTAAEITARARTGLGLSDEQDNLTGYAFVAPNVIMFVAFLFAPVLFALVLSFSDYSLLGGFQQWVGLQNYRDVLTPLPWWHNWKPLRVPTANLWWWALKTTFVYAIGTVPLQIFGGLAVALMLDKRVRAKKAYRAAYFMPVMLAGAASAVMWRWFLASDGIVNDILPTILEHNWVGDPATALAGVMLMAVWGGIGFNMILFLAGLQNIPDELYDAAHIDGAGSWHRFRHVTWPNLENTNFFVIVMAIIGAFQVFGIALVFSNGGPFYATTTTVLLIYQEAFEAGNMGYASAMAFLLFLLIFAFSYYQYRYRKSEEVEY